MDLKSLTTGAALMCCFFVIVGGVAPSQQEAGTFELHHLEDANKVLVFNTANGEFSYETVEEVVIDGTYTLNVKTPGYFDIRQH